MRIEELLEGISPVLFYRVGVGAALDIANRDAFRLSPTFTKRSEEDDRHSYYLSTTRTRTGKYHLGDSMYSVLFQLDGRSLSNNLSGRAVDYWGSDFRSAAGGAYEQEDRIFHNKGTITPASKFIQRVDILIGGDRDKQNKAIRDIINSYRQKGIPVRLFDRNIDWITGSNEISIGEFMKKSFPAPRQISREIDDDERFMLQRSLRKTHSDIGLILKAIRVNRREDFTSEEWRSLRRYITPIDARSSISAELHNAQNHSDLRKSLAGIGEFMRKNGIRSPSGLADYLVDKWRSQ